MRYKPFPIKKLDQSVVNKIDVNFDIAYKEKLASTLFTDSSTKYIKSFQEQELGRYQYVDTLLTGTSKTSVSVGFQNRFHEILNLQIEPIINPADRLYTVSVIDFTQTGYTVQIDVTSSIDKGTFEWFWLVIGAR